MARCKRAVSNHHVPESLCGKPRKGNLRFHLTLLIIRCPQVYCRPRTLTGVSLPVILKAVSCHLSGPASPAGYFIISLVNLSFNLLLSCPWRFPGQYGLQVILLLAHFPERCCAAIL